MENVPPILPNTRVLSVTVVDPLTRASVGVSPLFAGRLALLDRRQRLEVGLDAADELVVVASRSRVSFALRFSRSRRRRASAPARRSNLGHSAATTTPTPIASSTIHGQVTAPV